MEGVAESSEGDRFLDTTLDQNFPEKVGKDRLGCDLPERFRSFVLHDETIVVVRCGLF